MDSILDAQTSNALTQAMGGKQANLIAKTKVQAREAAEDFESVFIHQMMEFMWSGMETDGPFSGGHSEGVFRSMLNEQYAENISESGGIGIADNVYREILKMQEIDPNEYDSPTD